MIGTTHAASRITTLMRSQVFRAVLMLVLFGGCICSVLVGKQGAQAAPSPAAQQKMFATPQQAADALIQAAGSYDLPALEQILGPHSEDLLKSKDPVRDKNATVEFVAKARQKMEASVDPKDPARATLLVGDDDWPLPIPIVKKGAQWFFDTKAGRQDILYRRIGSNELDAIEICRGYVDAQLEYAMEKHDGSEVNQYAQRVISTPGKHDGLVWRNDDGTLGGPIAEGIAKALQQGYTDKSQPYHGYYFKILKGQGPAAPLGEMNFVVGGAMIGGFALAAAPAEYRVTGVQTFIVSYQGIVYQKDLGPDTLKIFRAMDLYNPDKTWHPTEDKWVPIKGADEPDQLTAKQITSAIDADLASKGLTKTDSDDANLYIGYQTAVGSEKQYTSYNTGWGYGPGWGAGYSGYGAVADKDTSGRVSPLLPPHPRRP